MSKSENLKFHLLEECYEPSEVTSKFIQELNDSDAGKAANKAMDKADEAERKAFEARDAATTAFEEAIAEAVRRVEEMGEVEPTFEEEVVEEIREAVEGAVRLYASNAGMEVDYSFGEEVEMWEASTC